MAGSRLNGVLLDANLLCLLVVGASGITAISGHPRLKTFGPDDYATLTAVLDRSRALILCPHVIAETSNLIGYRQNPAQAIELRKSFAHIIAAAAESSATAQRAVADKAYERLGVTDAVLLLLATDTSTLLLSDDLALCLEAGRRGLNVVNYNNLRDGALRLDQLP